MQEILGQAKTIKALLKGVKYNIDYYQREYKWQDKQISELLDDLCNKFLESYQPEHARTKVSEYAHYFLGSVIISKKEAGLYIVDGQQRLTSLTLLLMLLKQLQKDLPEAEKVNIDELIYSEKYGKRSFNLDVDERKPCMEALFDGQPFDLADKSESVQNLAERYHFIEDYFPECMPEEYRWKVLPYFIDWLLENVHLVEITAYSDEDAYTIFETMNDRGLSLSPTDMLKGYLLANIDDSEKRLDANTKWRIRIGELNDAGKEVEADCFKAWLRSQYAMKIRERKRGATQEDFDRIGTEYHRWLRDSKDTVGLKQSNDFYRFMTHDFDFYSRQYLNLIEASQKLVPGLEHVLYNAQQGFTLQNMVILAPLKPEDDLKTILIKQRLVAHYLDILLTWRLWNFHSIAYSTMQYAMFLVMRDIRGLEPEPLAETLSASLSKATETFTDNDRLRLNQQNRNTLQRILARITDYLETQSGGPSRYVDYVSDTGNNRYEVEHIWANKFDRHTDEFSHPTDFDESRNRIGGLLLLPKSFNASYNDLPYKDKMPHYLEQNLLAKSLHPQSYDRNPGFKRFIEQSGLKFKAYEEFKKADIEERSELYRQLAQKIWNPEDIKKDIGYGQA